MPAKLPQFRHRSGWRGRLILQVRYQYYDDGSIWIWDEWRDARVSDLPDTARPNLGFKQG